MGSMRDIRRVPVVRPNVMRILCLTRALYISLHQHRIDMFCVFRDDIDS